MSTGERGMQIKSDVNNIGWENSNFPIVCEPCIGDNPYVRMMRDQGGGTCKMCARPHTMYKWRPGRADAWKRTEVCQSCAKSRNLCQACILDMQLGLPSQLRDAVLAAHSDVAVATSNVGLEYQNNQRLTAMAYGGDDTITPAERLLEIARNVGNPENRIDPRVKIYHKPTDTIANGEVGSSSSRKRSLEESDPNNPQPLPLPPGVAQALTNQEYASSLQAGYFTTYSHLSVPLLPVVSTVPTTTGTIGIPSRTGTGTGQTSSSKPKTKGVKKKALFTPKPPSGPPPPSAFVAE